MGSPLRNSGRGIRGIKKGPEGPSTLGPEGGPKGGKMEIDKDALRAALAFLARAELKGSEVDAYIRVVGAIRNLIEYEEPEEPTP